MQGLHWSAWIYSGGFLRHCAGAAVVCLDLLRGFPQAISKGCSGLPGSIQVISSGLCRGCSGLPGSVQGISSGLCRGCSDLPGSVQGVSSGSVKSSGTVDCLYPLMGFSWSCFFFLAQTRTQQSIWGLILEITPASDCQECRKSFLREKGQRGSQ